MDLCKYKDILGPVGKGFHTHELFGIDFGFAILDLLATIIGSYLLSKMIGYSFWKVFIILTLIAIFLHWFFCIKTSLNVFFGL